MSFDEYSPMYCEINLDNEKYLTINTNGADSADIARGPRKLRGTTPGNSK